MLCGVHKISLLILIELMSNQQWSYIKCKLEVFILDIDECESGQDNCDVYASCTNTVGSFTCACKNGFYGDGVTCGGKRMTIYVKYAGM